MGAKFFRGNIERGGIDMNNKEILKCKKCGKEFIEGDILRMFNGKLVHKKCYRGEPDVVYNDVNALSKAFEPPDSAWG